MITGSFGYDDKYQNDCLGPSASVWHLDGSRYEEPETRLVVEGNTTLKGDLVVEGEIISKSKPNPKRVWISCEFCKTRNKIDEGYYCVSCGGPLPFENAEAK